MPPRRTIVPGPKPCVATLPPLSRASPEENGVVEKMKKRRRQMMPIPRKLFGKEHFIDASNGAW